MATSGNATSRAARKLCVLARSAALVIICVVGLAGPSTAVLANHYGFLSTYYNSYIIGWNTESGFNAGETQSVCGGDHWRHFSQVNIYGYASYQDPYINWIRLHSGTTVGSSAWIYGVSWLESDSEGIFIDSYADSFYSSMYYYVFSAIDSSDGNVALRTYKGEDPAGLCAVVGYHALERVG